MSVPEIERQIGIEAYATKSPGIGGAIKRSTEDFVVQEILVDGSKATIKKEDHKPALGATAGRQRFLLCILVKKNWDTFIAIKNMAIQLGIDQSRIQIAGIKDAKAVTAQHVTIEGISIEEASKVSIKDVELRPVGYFREQLAPFYLLGNNFKINIKSISNQKENIEKLIEKVNTELAEIGGIPNFYGHQRFGTTRPITHLIGKAMVGGKLDEAAMLFLAKPSIHEHPESMKARADLMSEKDFKRAFESFPKQLRFERLMLAYLAENPTDFVGAFRRLPLKLRLLFVQAYQSFLFNRFLSHRIKKGTPIARAEAGDFVVNVERLGLPMVRTGKIVDQTKLSEINNLISEGKVRVALPIVGFGQRLSQGEVGEAQHEILEAEGGSLENFRIASLPEIRGKGELRAAVTPIKNFSLDRLDIDPESPHKLRAQVEFTLLRSSYATVLLRELIKPVDLITSGF